MSRQNLSAEERALADKLARIAPRAEPSAALDARILAMAAQANAQTTDTTAPARKPRRWLPPLALAASLALVAGVIWRIHPVLNPEASSSQIATSEAEASVALPAMPEVAVEMDAAEASMPASAATAPTSSKDTAIATSTPAAKKPPPLPAGTAPISTPPAPATLPKSRPAHAAMAEAAAPRARQKSSEAASPPQAVNAMAELQHLPPPAPAPPAAPIAAEPAAMAVRAAPAAKSLDSLPPSEPEIARIRELMEQGKTRKARRALEKLIRRQPGLEIPDDLKPLLEQ